MWLRSYLVTRDAPDERWETLRLIRNSCIDGLTGYRGIVSLTQQDKYRDMFDANTTRHYLFYDGDRAVGFGVIKHVGPGKCQPSLGVAKWERGMGYGWAVAQLVLLLAGEDMVGELYLDNKAIQHIDYALGWYPVGEPQGDVQPVECKWPPPFVRLGVRR